MFFDPSIAANPAAAVAAAQDAMSAATLELGSTAELRALPLRVGTVVEAAVLAPRDGTDRLDIGGHVVRAVLPPELVPGETLRLHVTAIDGTRVFVRMLDASETPAPTSRASQTLAPASPTIGSTAPQRTAIPAQARHTAPRASGDNGAIAEAAPQTCHPERSEQGERSRRTATSATPTQARSGIDARIAFARIAPPHAPATAERESPATAARPSNTPHTDRLRALETSIVVRRPLSPGELLLQRVNVPRTPLTLAAARLVDSATTALARAFEQLDALLPSRTAEPRLIALKAALPFIARFDLVNERALPQRIAAYVSHAIEGSEAKIAAVVRGLRDGASQPAQAQGVERNAALTHDVKNALLALQQSPLSNAPPTLPAAVNDALTALTAVQLNVLNAMANDPAAMTLVLPAFYREGGQGAILRVPRDAPHAGIPIDGDNFRIGFVLDTASVGMLAIDIETVGRNVRVKVTTENPSQAFRVARALPDLGDRLQRLRYRVASMRADAAPATNVPTDEHRATDNATPAVDLRA